MFVLFKEKDICFFVERWDCDDLGALEKNGVIYHWEHDELQTRLWVWRSTSDATMYRAASFVKKAKAKEVPLRLRLEEEEPTITFYHFEWFGIGKRT